MLRFTAWSRQLQVSSIIVRYTFPILSAGAAFLLVSALRHFSVRDPVILIYLAAIALSFWYGQKGPGILAFILSTACLLFNFLGSEHKWLSVALYDLPTVCLYVGFAWSIESFSESRHRLENVLRRNGEELEAAIKVRAGEVYRVNAEYKTILDAAPFGIVLLGPDRIVQRCNPEYERMLGYRPGELLGKMAPLPEEHRDSWKTLEDTLRSGHPIVDYEASRLRRDASPKPTTRRR